jgi:hypothetical protein
MKPFNSKSMENINDFTGNVFSCGNITAQKLPASLGS